VTTVNQKRITDLDYSLIFASKADKENKKIASSDEDELSWPEGANSVNPWVVCSRRSRIFREYILQGNTFFFLSNLEQFDDKYEKFNLLCFVLEHFPEHPQYQEVLIRCNEIISQEQIDEVICDLISLLASSIYSKDKPKAHKMIEDMGFHEQSANAVLTYYARTKETAGLRTIIFKALEDLDFFLKDKKASNEYWDHFEDHPYPLNYVYSLIITLKVHSCVDLLEELQSKPYLNNFHKLSISLYLIEIHNKSGNAHQLKELVDAFREMVYQDPENYRWEFASLLKAFFYVDDLQAAHKIVEDFIRFEFSDPMEVAFLFRDYLDLMDAHHVNKKTRKDAELLSRVHLSAMMDFDELKETGVFGEYPEESLLGKLENMGPVSTLSEFDAEYLFYACSSLALGIGSRDIWDSVLTHFKPYISMGSLSDAYLYASQKKHWHITKGTEG